MTNDSETLLVKLVSKSLLALYVLILLWLVLFKFSVDLPEALSHNNTRILNLIPFANYSKGNIRELIYNFLAFIPFGLFLSVSFKRASLSKKLATIFVFSLVFEIIQFVLAMGIADVTDVISNTSGGLLGLILYELGKKHASIEELDRYIVVTGTVLLILSIAFLSTLFSSGVRFQSAPPAGEHRLRRY